MRERGRHTGRGREKQAPCREPDMGLDSVTPGSHPGLKAGAHPLSHPGVPKIDILKKMDIAIKPGVGGQDK